ncbi:MAG: IS30 family transposase [Anaerolineae bacterium]|nr:IS30 family transposase [Anaerolineae bacterium]
MSYAQLTHTERYQILALQRTGSTLAGIALELNRHVSTISREIRRNSTGDSYCADQAQALAIKRRREKPHRRIARHVRETVSLLVRWDWSPEQVSLWLAAQPGISVSHEWIYLYIYADKRAGGELHTHLRCQKARRKRYGGRDRRGQIKNRVSIDERPEIVAERSRIGDWEIDTIAGASRCGALLSLTERQSRDILLAKLPDCSADEVVYAALGLLVEQAKVHTITADNGKEFSGHEDIARVLEADFYFAHPYSPWERGTNENANGLVRQYFPKGRDFSTITQEELDHAMDRLNNRPRKCLGMQTPHQVLYGIKPDVALAT